MSDLRSQVQQALSGSYTLERELGGGGMSRVFVAQEHRLGRTVVIKVVSPELAAALSTPRFEREIHVAASLQQANIVPVLSAGDVDGLPYYTMPYIEGESLRARLGRGPLAIGETVSILRDVARALAYAHERGVVHRDIKPDNVLLSGHTAVVTDFGIAKAIVAAAQAPAGATLTQIGTAVGTPAYMAPEQAAGDPGTDHRADIYAFGCMAYELIAGRGPFPGLPPHKLVVAHMSEAPRPVAELRPDCPPALAALVMQCLAKEPATRPASATELLHRLDAVASPSGANAAAPAILMGGRGMLWRALGVYAAAFVAVAVLARAAIIAIGLPEWVFPGALVVMALGLPVVLFTAYTQYVARRSAMATPTYTPGGTQASSAHGTMATLAIRASPHMSWRRTARGGYLAVGAFTLLVAVFMVLRELGIGPAGSLLAAGKLAANDRVVVAAFEAPGADSSLGATIAEAVKTGLSQSRAVRIMPTSAVVATLRQMQRPDTARVNSATARQIAQRSGAKAIVAGSVVPAGNGYVVTVRLVAAETGNDLASFSESARDAGDLIPAVDRATRALRGRIGESLKAVRAAPSLEQVTTASLDALRSYSAGLVANDIQGNWTLAVQDFKDAIRLDSTFAMAWVQLAYSLQTLGGAARLAEANDALATAFRLRSRLPEAERYNVEGAYYNFAGHDRGKSIAALRRAVALDSSNVDAANSLGVVLSSVRDTSGAVAMYKLALAGDSMNGTVLGNLATSYLGMGRYAEVDSVVGLLIARRVPFVTGRVVAARLWATGQLDSAEHVLRAGAADSNLVRASRAQNALADMLQTRGRLRDAGLEYVLANTTAARANQPATNPYRAAFSQALRDGFLRGNAAQGISDLDAALRSMPVASAPAVVADQAFPNATVYVLLGAPAKARDLFTARMARLDSSGREQNAVNIARTRGSLEMAAGRTDSAVAYFRQGDNEPDGLPTNNCMACTPLFLGLAFDRGGRADSARKYLAAYVELPYTKRANLDPFFLAPTLFRLGELYEDGGDSAHALEYYGRFVELWKNADPELQPRVAEARKRMARLGRSKG